ncbi:lipocalin-like domain-containing protein [Caulobacter sp. RL271]|uniref:Lipocalin-like domain-containing protein n=1 Tax=Caulobacter segnis TaxID=88688 RepID=A0ABY4ZR93_9CAUL|nr:lipocalin-like domain-containing protein [Caulobacter segnis]USQ95111.1 lipocalin-like domain-containing protein [Caulobacter segnis]
MRNAMTGLALLLALLLASGGAAGAADFPLAGTWTLTAADRITPAGVREPDYGAAPKGRLIVDATGRYSLQIFKSERTGFASGDKKRGTPQEYADAALGSSTHYGTIAIDAAAHQLVFRIEGASFKNWEGTTQRRAYDLKGDRLSYRVPTAPDGNVPVSEWRRER